MVEHQKLAALVGITEELLTSILAIPPINPSILPPQDMPWGMTDEEEDRWWAERKQTTGDDDANHVE